MTYPIIRIKALGNRRFEVLPARKTNREEGACSTENFEFQCDLFHESCRDTFPICSQHKIVFKEIFK